MTHSQQTNSEAIYKIARKIRMIAFDFDGVFTDNRVIVSQDGAEAVICNRSDGIGLEAVRNKGIATLVISTEVNPVTSVRCKKLKVPCFQACENKLKVLEKRAGDLDVPLKEIAYLGNDINDLDCLKKVGLPACVSDSHPDVLKVALYLTKLPGGNGAVREFCDFIVKVKDGKLP